MRLALIGAGNLAWNLAHALKGSPWQPEQVISRQFAHASALAQDCGVARPSDRLSDLDPGMDLVLICSSDHIIGQIAQELAPHAGTRTMFAHTAGSVPLEALAPLSPRAGVFYPMQTFTKGHPADFAPIPIFLEGPEPVLARLRPLAEHLSRAVRVLDSAQRLQLHLGAVFASNFANFMWILAEDALQGLEGLDLKVYQPLVRECVEKAFHYGPANAQTGPARRGDAATMQKHMQVLQAQDPARAHIYQLISEMITKKFEA